MFDIKLVIVNFGLVKDCIEVVFFIILLLLNVDVVFSLFD